MLPDTVLPKRSAPDLPTYKNDPSGRFRVTYLRLRLATIVPRPVATSA
jgi:hypothetical protein